MRNPLMLPFAALGVAADVVRALTGIPRVVAALEAGLDRLERLTQQGDAVLGELEQARPMVEKLTAQTQAALDQMTESTKLVERLMTGGDDVIAAADRTREEAAQVRKLIERTIPSAEQLAEFARPILDASIAARDQLESTERELARANESVERMLDMAQPIERVTGRMERITGAFRRNSSAENES